MDLDRLESVAQQLVARLREEDPHRVHAWLAMELPEPKDWYRLCFVLACAVPDPAEKTWIEMTSWARPVEVKPQRARSR